MAEPEKVIDGLRRCESYGYCEDKQCPYYECTGCLELLRSDALELLKAHEPRVMTLEEVKNNVDNPCWFESHGTYMGYEGFWIIPYAFTAWETMYYVFPLMQINERGDSHYSELGLPAYNKTWRCWTSRPTDEQREATPWVETPKEET